MFSTSPADALPVRTPANSFTTTCSVLIIFSSASSRMSSSVIGGKDNKFFPPGRTKIRPRFQGARGHCLPRSKTCHRQRSGIASQDNLQGERSPKQAASLKPSSTALNMSESMALNRRLEKASRPLVMALSVALVAVIGLVDYLTGSEIYFSTFYLLPVGLVAWVVGGLGVGVVLDW